MRLTKRFAAAALTAVMTAGMLGGCTQLEHKANSEVTAATFGDTKIMLDDVLYRVRSAQYSYEAYFGSDICNSDMGDGSGATVGDYIKETVMTQLRQTLVLNEYAQKNGIELTDSQKKLAEDARDRFLENNTEYAQAVGATKELVEKDIFENALANAVYLKLVEDVDTTVGEDEFLRKKIAYVRLTPSQLTEITSADELTTEADSKETGSGEASTEEASAEKASSEPADQATSAEQKKEESADTTPEASAETATEEETKTDAEEEPEATEAETMSAQEAERQEAMEAAAQEILEKFQKGETAADFIDAYKNDSHFTATNSEISISEEGTAVYVKEAWKLATDECTIYNSEDGSMYIIRCLNDNDESARQMAIDSEIESRKSKLFAEKYAQIEKDSSRFKVDEKVMETIRFTTPVFVLPTEEETSSEEASAGETGSEEGSSEAEEDSTAAERSSEEAASTAEKDSEEASSAA